MRAVARVTWLYFTLLPLQRWLAWIAGGIALLLIGLGVLLGVRPPSAATFIAAALSLPAAIALTPVLLTAGAAFRYVSAPRSHRLLPRFRARMLGSLALLAAVICAAASLLIVAGVTGAGAPLTALPFIVAAAFCSACLYFVFRMTRITLAFVVEGLAWFLVIRVGAAVVGRMEPGQLAAVGAAGLLLGWITFAIWYLRTARIAPVDFTGQQLMSGRRVRLPARLTRREAANVLLTGRAPLKPAGALLGGAAAAAVFGLLLMLVGDAMLDSLGPLDLEGLVAIGGGLGALAIHQVGSRARYLWLVWGDSRSDVLGRVEAANAMLLLSVAAFATTLIASIHFLARPVGPDRAAVSLLLLAGLAGIGTYLCLALARNLGPLEIGAWIAAVLSTSIAYAGTNVGIWPDSILVGVVSLQLAAAGLLRLVALRSWRSVDWLRFKAIRPGAGILRSTR